jgi:hypothetical protein
MGETASETLKVREWAITGDTCARKPSARRKTGHFWRCPQITAEWPNALYEAAGVGSVVVTCTRALQLGGAVGREGSS